MISKNWKISLWNHMSNKSNRSILSFLVITTLTMTVMLYLLPPSVARHGPHHPRSAVRAVHSTHHHHVPVKSEDGEIQKITEDRQLLQDKEHIKEDMGEWMFDGGREPSPEEMEFHYFKMHDFDNNSHLDGLEILQALTHVLPMSDEPETEHAHSASASDKVKQGSSEKNSQGGFAVNYEAKRQTLNEEDFNYYIDLIDKVLEEDDLNNDGFLSYAEYVVGRRKDDESGIMKHA